MSKIDDEQLQALRPDALAGTGLAAKAEAVGASKAALPLGRAFLLACMAGLFIGLGATFMLVVKADSALTPAVSAVLGGVAFSVGLFLVVVAGAELFTGNNLMVIGCLSGRYGVRDLLRSWCVVYLGNLVGSLVLVALAHLAGLASLSGGTVGETIVSVAVGKVSMAPMTLLCRAILCNVLVCLAVWMSFACRTVVDKLCAVTLPVAAFVACGFEHCVANMYFLPLGLVTALSGVAPAGVDVAALTPGAVVVALLVATAGNMIGGAGLVGCGYWLAYGRRPKRS